MSFEYVSVEEAIAKPGLRMVVVGGVPSPWSEAAKGLFAIKNIDWTATRLARDEPGLRERIGGITAPAVLLDDEPPRTGWAQILLLAERLAPEPSLVPSDASDRALMMGLCQELLGEGGLCWSRRLQATHAGLSGQGGFSPKVSGYLAKKYGYHPEATDAVQARVVDLLRMFSARLENSSGDYLLGETMTAADVYLACSVALFAPLPPEQCAMLQPVRDAYEWFDEDTKAAVHPVLLTHRDRMYERHLELPLAL
ncbi:MAG: glutathione S-transferase family protein [Nannocystaceae bacterium]|nr:glutathione S-transferase family protein [Nannocystaceae bacterium]